MIRRKTWGMKRGGKILIEFFDRKADAKIAAALFGARVVRLEVRVVEVHKS